MDVFTEMAKYPVFTIDDVKRLTGNKKTAYSKMNRLLKKGQIKKIRNNIYSVVNPTTGDIVANRFQIGCALTSTAFISHHSAFEYYGLSNQVFYEVYISSETKFNRFTYGNMTYKHVKSKMNEGIIQAKNTIGVRITDLERTVIDSIRDLNKISGYEELLNCLESVHYLDEAKLKHYLDIYNTQGLYQKVGYILNIYRNDMQLSEGFIEYCRNKIGRSRRYLVNNTKENSYYNRDWELMIPKDHYAITEFRGEEIA